MSIQREWHGCTNTAGHKFNEGVCEEPGCGFDLRFASERIEAIGKGLAQAVEAHLRQELGLCWARIMSLERKNKLLQSELNELKTKPSA